MEYHPFLTVVGPDNLLKILARLLWHRESACPQLQVVIDDVVDTCVARLRGLPQRFTFPHPKGYPRYKISGYMQWLYSTGHVPMVARETKDGDLHAGVAFCLTEVDACLDNPQNRPPKHQSTPTYWPDNHEILEQFRQSLYERTLEPVTIEEIKPYLLDSDPEVRLVAIRRLSEFSQTT